MAIRKKPGTDLGALKRLYATFRRIRPTIVHTRNLAALDALLPARLAGVPLRIHGEHGWDVNDLAGNNRKLRLLRRLHAPLVQRYIALSEHLQRYLIEQVGVREDRIRRVCNGVDIVRFAPRQNGAERLLLPADFAGNEKLVIGTVGRLQAVKDPVNLVNAFATLVRNRPDFASRARLVIVGDGALRQAVTERVRECLIERFTWLPGERDDIPEILRSLDIFVQPSLAEGISNTILEAMASGVPVVATKVGGNAELVEHGTTGMLVPPADSAAIVSALDRYADDPELRLMHGRAGRRRAETGFSIQAMVARYVQVYDELLASA